MANTKITILTEPPTLLNSLIKLLRKIKRTVKTRKIYTEPKYGGHYAVTRSIIEGFKKINANFNYNPSIANIYETVYVPGGLPALRYAIKLKKAGKIKKLVAGPNLTVLPSEITSIKDHRLIDLYLQPSEWVVNWWKKIDPNFPLKITWWYAGIDQTIWTKSDLPKNKKTAIIYNKRPQGGLINDCVDFLNELGFKVETLNYGTYTIEKYRELLGINSCVIHFVEQESQGISLAEAWATDTPTIVWNPGHFNYNGIEYDHSSASPYLTSQTGEFFKNLEEFENIFSRWSPEKYSPRAWVMENMTDEVSSKKLLSLINNA